MVAGLVVDGVYQMEDDQLEERIYELRRKQMANEAETQLIQQYKERVHFHSNGDNEGEAEGKDEDEEHSCLDRCCLSSSDEDAETEEQPNKCGCYNTSETNCLGCEKQRTTGDLELNEENGPFTNLAFDSDPSGSHRVYVTREAYNSLIRWRAFFVLVGVVIGAGAVYTFVGLIELMRADFDPISASKVGRHVDGLFFPIKGCVPDLVYYVYGLALLTFWLPSCLMAAMVWPCWLSSLLLVSNRFYPSISFTCHLSTHGRFHRLWRLLTMTLKT